MKRNDSIIIKLNWKFYLLLLHLIHDETDARFLRAIDEIMSPCDFEVISDESRAL